MKQKLDAGSKGINFSVRHKRIISVVLCVVLIFSIIPKGTSAASNTVAYAVEGGQIYFDTSSGAITFADDTITSIVIPDKINGVMVTSIGEHEFYKNDVLESVTLPNELTTIGEDAFSGCTALTDINFPEKLSVIGEDAFYDCECLTNIELPSGLSIIGDHAFHGCDALSEIVIPASVTEIGFGAFFGTSISFFSVEEGNTSYSRTWRRHCI